MTPISSIVFICQGLIVHGRLYTPRLADDARGRYNPPQSIEKTCIVRPSKMAVEQTLSIIKPDATGRNVTGIINAAIEKAGLRIVAQKRVRWALEDAQRFYAEHKGRPFYDDLCAFMTSAPIVVQVLEGEDAIAKYRKVMGATDPAEAKKGTIRRRFARTMAHNSVHGSDSAASATREITLNFRPDEIVG